MAFIRLPKTFIAFFFLIFAPINSQADLLDNPFAMPRYSLEYDEDRDPYKDSANAMQFAAQTERRVLIEIGGDWCGWCHVLDQFIRDHDDVANFLQNHFVLLKVNVSDANKNEKFMAELPAVDGYPYVFITDPDGTIHYAGDLTALAADGNFVEEKFMAFLKQWQPVK